MKAVRAAVAQLSPRVRQLVRVEGYYGTDDVRVVHRETGQQAYGTLGELPQLIRELIGEEEG